MFAVAGCGQETGADASDGDSSYPVYYVEKDPYAPRAPQNYIARPRVTLTFEEENREDVRLVGGDAGE